MGEGFILLTRGYGFMGGCSDLLPNIWDFQYNLKYVQFSPLKFNTDFNNDQNLLIFGLVTVCKNQKIL